MSMITAWQTVDWKTQEQQFCYNGNCALENHWNCRRLCWKMTKCGIQLLWYKVCTTNYKLQTFWKLFVFTAWTWTDNTSLMSTPNAIVRRISPIAVSCDISFKLYFVLKTHSPIIRQLKFIRSTACAAHKYLSCSIQLQCSLGLNTYINQLWKSKVWLLFYADYCTVS